MGLRQLTSSQSSQPDAILLDLIHLRFKRGIADTCTRTKHADVGKRVGIVRGRHDRLRTTHRQAGDGAMLLVRVYICVILT
jgi:hypothetical protein